MPRAFEPKARLGWQQKGGEFTFEPYAGPNRVAAEAMVAHLRTLHHLEAVDGAQVQAFVMLAESVDSDPTNGALWGQYRAAELQLRGVTDRGKESTFESLLKELGASGPVVPDAAKPKSANARRAGRSGVGGVGATADASPAADRRRGGGAAS